MTRRRKKWKLEAEDPSQLGTERDGKTRIQFTNRKEENLLYLLPRPGNRTKQNHFQVVLRCALSMSHTPGTDKLLSNSPGPSEQRIRIVNILKNYRDGVRKLGGAEELKRTP